MSKKFCVNNNIPTYVPKKLHWTERDGLMMYIDRSKFEQIAYDFDGHFENVYVVNFDIMHHQCRGKIL